MQQWIRFWRAAVDTYSQPAFFGAIVLMLWLVIKGARPPALDATASSSAAGQVRDKNRTLKTAGCSTQGRCSELMCGPPPTRQVCLSHLQVLIITHEEHV